jgi:hypothetical protein
MEVETNKVLKFNKWPKTGPQQSKIHNRQIA